MWNDCSIDIKIERKILRYINQVELNNNDEVRDVLGATGNGDIHPSRRGLIVCWRTGIPRGKRPRGVRIGAEEGSVDPEAAEENGSRKGL